MTIQELEKAMLTATDKAEQVLLFTELMKAKAHLEREIISKLYETRKD